jgi:rSAM/selenodomain-associated transferase 2
MISIVVPVYNEEETLNEFIFHISKIISNRKAELIFVDGGSTDRTLEIAKKSVGKIYQSPSKGRAAQMNFGASKAKGNILYFLHADSIPPETFIDDIYEMIKKGFPVGSYRLDFDSDHLLLRFYAWFTKFDINVFRFGDQSLYVQKDVFSEVGGFDDSLKVMEDQQIIVDLKKHAKFVIMEGTVKTSSRKYKKIGILRLQLIFAIIVILYYMKVNQNIIVDFYSQQLN